MLRIKKLVIHQYRDVAPGTTLEFSDGINVLLGRNGTGKTTMLNLIAMIARADFSPLKAEQGRVDFDYTYLTGGDPNVGGSPGIEAWLHMAVESAAEAERGGTDQVSPEEGTVTRRWFIEYRIFHTGDQNSTPLSVALSSDGPSVFSPPTWPIGGQPSVRSTVPI